MFLIGESASFTDLPTEMTEEERRAELRKPEKDRVKVSQEELDLVQYKKWWNKQVRNGDSKEPNCWTWSSTRNGGTNRLEMVTAVELGTV